MELAFETQRIQSRAISSNKTITARNTVVFDEVFRQVDAARLAKKSVGGNTGNAPNTSAGQLGTSHLQPTVTGVDLPQVFSNTQPEKIIDSGLVELGKLSRDNPTVSHLLEENESLRPRMWEIVSTEINREKKFENLPLGTTVWFDQAREEIVFDRSGANYNTVSQQVSDKGGTSDLNDLAKTDRKTGADQIISLGKINSENSTVSHLLTGMDGLKNNGWDILDSAINSNKPFNTLTSGTEVFLNTETGEISWQSTETQNDVVKLAAVYRKKEYPAISTPEDSATATDLSDAVKRYLGRPYGDMNCYELVVRGLQDLNVAYAGKDGLQTKLTKMALDRGMAANAYLNGEGLVKAAGSTLFSKTYPVSGDWKEKADQVMEEIQPLLQNGQILSFSTRRRGHTGVVSQQGEQWTFVNSGRLDNSVETASLAKGVGEEVLQMEIGNWFRLAKRKGEELSVTLGRLEQDKLQLLTASAVKQYEAHTI